MAKLSASGVISRRLLAMQAGFTLDEVTIAGTCLHSHTQVQECYPSLWRGGSHPWAIGSKTWGGRECIHPG